VPVLCRHRLLCDEVMCMKTNDCPHCRGQLGKKNVLYAFAGVPLGRFPAEVCQQCGEMLFWSAVHSSGRGLSPGGRNKTRNTGCVNRQKISKWPLWLTIYTSDNRRDTR
jgi:hypothetical protein